MTTERKSPYRLTAPCAKCPFRRDIPPYLTPARVREIERSLDRAEFPCHETVNYDVDDDRDPDTRDSVHCAGALILLEKIERPSQMMRICERIGMYDPTKLRMDAPVYDDFDEMEEACERASSRSGTKRSSSSTAGTGAATPRSSSRTRAARIVK